MTVSTLALLRAARLVGPGSDEAMVARDRVMDLGYSPERARCAVHADRLDALQAMVASDPCEVGDTLRKKLNEIAAISESSFDTRREPNRSALRYLRARVVTAAIEQYERGTASARHWHAILPARRIRDTAQWRFVHFTALRSRKSTSAIWKLVEDLSFYADKKRWSIGEHLTGLMVIASNANASAEMMGTMLHDNLQTLYESQAPDRASGAALDAWAAVLTGIGRVP